jgi:hypothetical protein
MLDRVALISVILSSISAFLTLILIISFFASPVSFLFFFPFLLPLVPHPHSSPWSVLLLSAIANGPLPSSFSVPAAISFGLCNSSSSTLFLHKNRKFTLLSFSLACSFFVSSDPVFLSSSPLSVIMI